MTYNSRFRINFNATCSSLFFKYNLIQKFMNSWSNNMLFLRVIKLIKAHVCTFKGVKCAKNILIKKSYSLRCKNFGIKLQGETHCCRIA